MEVGGELRNAGALLLTSSGHVTLALVKGIKDRAQTGSPMEEGQTQGSIG